ncbi:MAG: Bax inhibitor-1/YccA family protein [Oscillospiraceae bacterium]|nr:Bax inhibitor-1/YccA family protein [Oscillospiraceae bacterium]
MFGNKNNRGVEDDRQLGRGFEDDRFSDRDRNINRSAGNRAAAYGEGGDIETRSAVYVAKVMGWMCVGLLTTVVAAMAVLSIESLFMLVFGSGTAVIVIVVAQFACVIALSAAIQKMSVGVATVTFIAYSALTGLTMSVFVLIYELSSLLLAFSVTTFMFLSMAAYGFATKKDLTTLGRLAFFGLIGIIVAMIANFFLGNSMLDLGITILGVLVFTGLIAYDTQNIKGIYYNAMASGYDEDSPEVRKLAIYGALKLYLDFINLFIMLLRLLGRRR